MTSSRDERGAGRTVDVERQLSAWAASGAMALTGGAGSGPLGPPEGMVPKLSAVSASLRRRAAAMEGTLDIDPLALLGERAAIAGLKPGGDVACGGTTRLLRAGSEWLAVTLGRPADLELVPAWIEVDEPVDDAWARVAAAASTRPAGELADRAVLLGLPIGLLPRQQWDGSRTPGDGGPPPIRRVAVPGPPTAAGPLSSVVVIDLSSLWAGPLCGSLLAAAGARVIKVESVTRPDGARFGPAAFFDLLNAHKLGVALDLRTDEGAGVLRRLLWRADVVIEASRPRALEQLGVDPLQVLACGTARVWASITGHGRTGAGRDRVAFGDDAAVAGGLACWAGGRPNFCVDAVADPATGLVAAAGILDALATEGRWLLDISMAEVAAHLAGPTVPRPARAAPVSPPRARVASGRGPRLGEHTAAVLADF